MLFLFHSEKDFQIEYDEEYVCRHDVGSFLCS